MENTSNTLVFDSSNVKLEFGRCIKNSQSEQIEELRKSLLDVPFEHAPDCPIDHIYKNKSAFELEEINNKFQSMNKKVKFASVGIVIDKDVSNSK
jgi:hypothetical protein